MNILSDIKQKLIKEFPNAKAIELEGEGCSLQIHIIADEFATLNSLQRQRRVNAILKEDLNNERLHAVTIHAYSPGEVN